MFETRIVGNLQKTRPTCNSQKIMASSAALTLSVWVYMMDQARDGAIGLFQREGWWKEILIPWKECVERRFKLVILNTCCHVSCIAFKLKIKGRSVLRLHLFGSTLFHVRNYCTPQFLPWISWSGELARPWLLNLVTKSNSFLVFVKIKETRLRFQFYSVFPMGKKIWYHPKTIPPQVAVNASSVSALERWEIHSCGGANRSPNSRSKASLPSLSSFRVPRNPGVTLAFVKCRYSKQDTSSSESAGIQGSL